MVEPEVTVEETDFTESVLQEVENRMSESEKVEEEAAPQTEPPVDDSGEINYSQILFNDFIVILCLIQFCKNYYTRISNKSDMKYVGGFLKSGK